MKKKLRFSLFFLLILFMRGSMQSQNVQKPFDIDLWQQGMPNTNGMDSAPFDESKGNFKPSIRVFLPAPELATGRVIVACPGGSYSHLAYNHEGYDWAPFFNKQGIALVVLKYRMPKGGHKEVPFSDAEEVLKMVRDSADVWNINPNDVGIMGFSAGGHLASTIATHTSPELRPNFQILFYPVITMDKSYTHMGSHDNLLGKDAPAELEEQYSNEKQVTKDTPRAFIVYSDDDKTVPPANGVNYYLALNKKGVPAALHVYPSGGHGWGIREDFIYKNLVLDELSAWLRSFKAPRKDAIRVACIGNSITYGSRLRNPEKDAYPTILGRMLGDGYWVKNFGIGSRTMLNKGDHPYMKEQKYKDALAFNPNIVVIKLGTNDSKPHNWVHKDEFAKDMQTMIDAFGKLTAHPKIYLCYPSKSYDNYGISDKTIVNEIIPMIKKLAKKNKLSVIDLYTAMDGIPELFPDKVHPNEKGAEIIAKTVYGIVKE